MAQSRDLDNVVGRQILARLDELISDGKLRKSIAEATAELMKLVLLHRYETESTQEVVCRDVGTSLPGVLETFACPIAEPVDVSLRLRAAPKMST